MPVHEGHRSRKKEQFRAHGLDAFADHEVLELLLYYAVPRQDTNPIAHRLMEKFGSLDAVFAADHAALEEVARPPARTRRYSAIPSRRARTF